MCKKLNFNQRYVLYKEIKSGLINNELDIMVRKNELTDRIDNILIDTDSLSVLQEAYNKYKQIPSNRYLDLYFTERLIDFKLYYYADKLNLFSKINVLLKKYTFLTHNHKYLIKMDKLILEFILSIINKEYLACVKLNSYQKFELENDIRTCIDFINEELKKDNQLFSFSLNNYFDKINKTYIGYPLDISDIKYVDMYLSDHDNIWGKHILDSNIVKEKYSSIHPGNHNIADKIIDIISKKHGEENIFRIITVVIELFRGMDKINLVDIDKNVDYEYLYNVAIL